MLRAIKKYVSGKCNKKSCFLCVVLFVLLCTLWDIRVSKSIWEPQYTETYELPQWTWLCVKKQCEKHYSTENTTMQSLISCNMFCGSSMLWPQPSQSFSYSNSAVAITLDSFRLKITDSPSGAVTEHIIAAYKITKHYLEKLWRPRRFNVIKYDKMTKVIVAVSVLKDKKTMLSLSTNEKYSLMIDRNDTTLTVNIVALSFCGARHGLVTFTQNIWYEPYASSLLIREKVSIDDAPRFNYRGLMLDTARNFFPMTDLFRVIDGMSASKLNTFHWHISDSQSFPLRLDSVPELAEHGAYSPEEVYTTQDVRTLVSYARVRGVRILIEVDAPGHVGRAWRWGSDAGLGELAQCIDKTPWQDYCGEPPCGQLNPKNPNVYVILQKIYTEIMKLTHVKDIFHLGGDEVNENCWNSVHQESAHELWLNFTQNAVEVLKEANGGVLPKLTLVWTSELTNNFLGRLKKIGLSFHMWDTMVDSSEEAQVVISSLDPWYLDCGFGSWTDNSESHCRFHSWQQVYEFRHWPHSSRSFIRWRVYGGEVCQWTETLNSGGLDYRTWPRAAAVAERLWQDKTRRVTPDVYTRLDGHNDRLAVYGITPAPLWPKWCVNNPTKCVKKET